MGNTQHNNFNQPVDYEALPFPKKQAPKLIQLLVKQLPSCWQQTAALALLPSLSVACGRVSYSIKNKPLAFHVAVHGKAGSGKTQFTCAPATFVQGYLSRNDNSLRHEIEIREAYIDEHGLLFCPKVLGFEISTVQLSKYLRFAEKETVMLYTDEISSAVASDGGNCSFLQLQPMLRKAYDGIEHTMDYKDKDSFRGKIKPRLSYLVCGTPVTMFRYFSPQATEQGTTRRTILVEHPMYRDPVKDVSYTQEERDYIHSELDWLSQQHDKVYCKQIEAAALAWKQQKQQQAGEDEVKLLMINTPADTFMRAAYLAHVLNHYNKARINDAIAFGAWVAEYQLRAYTNLTYKSQVEENAKASRYMAIPTQVQQQDFNEQMLQDLPEQFTTEQLIQYRIDHQYPHNPHSLAIITRWKKANKIISLGNSVFKKQAGG